MRRSGGPEAELHGETALRIFEQLGDLTEQAHMLNNMACSGSPKAAGLMRCMFARAAETYRRLGDAPNAANADYNRAEVLVRQAGRTRRCHSSRTRSGSPAPSVTRTWWPWYARKWAGRRAGRAIAAGLILLEEARTELTRLREPQEVVDADIASAEAHLLAGRPEQAWS